MAASGSTTIQLYNSSTASAVPTSGNLVQGELGINVTDKKIYTKNASAAVVVVGFGPDASVALTALTGLTVASGGASITGNTSVTGTLGATGAFSFGSSSLSDIGDFHGQGGVGAYVRFVDDTNSATRGYIGYGSTLFSANLSDFGIRSQGNLLLSSYGTVAATFDSNQNLCIGGTGTNGYHLEVTGPTQAKNTIGQTYQGVGASAMWIDSAGAWSLGLDSANGATTRVKVDAGGNLSVTGNVTTSTRLIVGGTATSAALLQATNTGGTAYFGLDSSAGGLGGQYSLNIWHSGNYPIVFAQNNTERARIDTSGNLLVGTSTTSSFHRLVKNNPGDWAASVRNTSSSNPYGLTVNFEGVTGGAGQFFISCQDDTARFRVLGNGNVQNINNSYGAISDEKLKDILGPAASYWDKYKLVQFINYCLKADPDKLKLLGVSAQQLRTVFPGLIDENADYKEVTKTREVPAVLDAEGNEVKPAVTEEYIERVPTGTTTLSVKYSVLGTIADVVTQEAQLRIEALEAANAAILQRLAALEAA